MLILAFRHSLKTRWSKDQRGWEPRCTCRRNDSKAKITPLILICGVWGSRLLKARLARSPSMIMPIKSSSNFGIGMKLLSINQRPGSPKTTQRRCSNLCRFAWRRKVERGNPQLSCCSINL